MRLVLADRIHTMAAGRTGAAERGAGTVDAGPGGDAAAALLRRGRIVRVGRRRQLEPLARSAELLDLRGTTVTPGLTDAHIHLVEWALARRQADLSAAASPAEAARTVARHARDATGDWVRGHGWNPHLWDESPTREALDRHLPDRPVALFSHDMHALWVNSAALRRAGVDAGTVAPDGGRIERDAAGEPTGLLLEDAARLIADRMPRPGPAETAAAVAESQAELHALGITGVHSVEMPGAEFRSLAVLEGMRAADRLRLRVLQHLPAHLLDDADRLGLRSGFGDGWLRIGGVKMFLDGALGSRTAWLRAPYEGTDDCGIRTLAPAEFEDAVRHAAEAGIASTVHAIGDAAVGLALDVLAAPEHGVGRIPHRIEHVQLCPPERLGDAARAGIVCSVQPAHLMTDWRAADRHWGRERCRGAFAFRSLLRGRSGAPGAGGADGRAAERAADGNAVREHGPSGILAFGSDAPVEPVDPRLGLYAAVHRRDRDGGPEGGWFPGERLRPVEALRAYTVGPARAAGETHRLGRLAPGFAADLVAWDEDPLRADGRSLLELRCVATIVAGEVVRRGA